MHFSKIIARIAKSRGSCAHDLRNRGGRRPRLHCFWELRQASDVERLGDLYGVVNLDAEVANKRLAG